VFSNKLKSEKGLEQPLHDVPFEIVAPCIEENNLFAAVEFFITFRQLVISILAAALKCGSHK
jgi:hypothetical protein